MSKVNLDALIPREDFEILKESQGNVPFLPAIAISELENGKVFLAVLKKPDFQRETNEWTPEKVCQLILSFLNDDLIPSIILWNSGSRNFVIDGAHRLSALIAWVLDDYGDGILSNPFFGGKVSPGQNKMADKTRKLIKRDIGTYKEHLYVVVNPKNADPDMLQRAQRMASLSLQLQWVRGNADKAEESFFKINEEAAPINDTEKTLLRCRNMPNAIAARAIVRSGTGHKYWSKFTDEKKKEEIEQLAKEINSILFEPELETPIKTLDIPLAGKGYSSETLPLIFDLLNVCNDIERKKVKEKDVSFYRKDKGNEIEITDDETGEQTINILKRTRKILFRITNNHASSLGLHPAVYFYSNTGRYQITSFLAIIELFKEYERNSSFKQFIAVRESFEDFLLIYKIFVNQSTVKFGSGLKGYKQLKKLYSTIIEKLQAGKTIAQVVPILLEIDEYKYLNPSDNGLVETNRKGFNTEAKSSVFLSKALENPIKCAGCLGLMHRNAATIDHKRRKQDGGSGSSINGQLMHPFCNSTVKN